MILHNIFHTKYDYNIHMKIHNIEKKIFDQIKKEKIVTSSEIAQNLKISWNTAEKYLLELALKNKVERVKKQGVNLWLEKK